MKPNFQSNTKTHFKKYWEVYFQWFLIGIYFLLPKDFQDSYFHILLFYLAYSFGRRDATKHFEWKTSKIHHAPVLPFKPKKGCLYYRLFMGTPKLFQWDGSEWIEQEDDPLYPLKAEVRK